MNIDANSQKQINVYFTSFKEVELVYLFGSVAENRDRPNSDIDFAVLFNEKLSSDERFKLRLKVIGDLTTILHRNDVEAVDLAEVGPAFQFETFKNRKEIFVRHNLKRILFETQTSLEYFDRIHYIKRHTYYGLKNL